MDTCAKCKDNKDNKLWFDWEYGPREYGPNELLAGRRDSVIWIVGLNPKHEKTMPDLRTLQALSAYFDDKDREGSKVHRYFQDWKKVSQTLWDMLGEHYGVAHVDLVACESKTFPRGDVAKEIIANCEGYLKTQIERERPKILICNGSPVSTYMLRAFPPPFQLDRLATSYITSIAGKELSPLDTSLLAGEEMAVVLSGFIGRIDDYAKRRLGNEIETYMARYQIGIRGKDGMYRL